MLSVHGLKLTGEAECDTGGIADMLGSNDLGVGFAAVEVEAALVVGRGCSDGYFDGIAGDGR